MTLKDAMENLRLEWPPSTLDLDRHPDDRQGWDSDNPAFEHVFKTLRPKTIIEVGTWKGASALHMAGLLKQFGIDGSIVCVDTFLGAVDHYVRDDLRPLLPMENGFPTLYHTFAANIMRAGFTDCIFPFPQTSIAAWHYFSQCGVTVDCVYIDGSHDPMDVFLDVTCYWQLVRPGGVLMGDDYSSAFPGVVHAVDEFCQNEGLDKELLGQKWIIRKPEA